MQQAGNAKPSGNATSRQPYVGRKLVVACKDNTFAVFTEANRRRGDAGFELLWRTDWQKTYILSLSFCREKFMCVCVVGSTNAAWEREGPASCVLMCRLM